MQTIATSPESLARCIEESFSNVECPARDELAAGDTYMDRSFVAAVEGKKWQELRPLRTHLGDGGEIVLLSPKAYQYYLPAYLYALIDPAGDEFYLFHVLDSLWHEPLYSDVLGRHELWEEAGRHLTNEQVRLAKDAVKAAPNRQRQLWEERVSLLTAEQKRCIARLLVHILRRTDDRFLEEGSEARRMERMLQQYWSFYL